MNDRPISLNELLARVEAQPTHQDKERMVVEHLAHLRGLGISTPLVGVKGATFIHYGTPFADVRVIGDFTDWGNAPQRLEPVPGVPLYRAFVEFPIDARVEYKILLNGQGIDDALNHRAIDNGVGGVNNYFTMPEHRSSPAAEFYSEIGHGTLVELGFHSDIMGEAREVRVYLPQGYNPDGAYPVAYFHDGYEYLSRTGVTNVMDYQVARGAMQPIIGVFIKPVRRNEEYLLSDRYVDFVTEELVPFVESKVACHRDRASRCTMGISLGALISGYIVARRSDLFGLLGSQSGVFFREDSKVIRMFDGGAIRVAKAYLEAGIYEYEAIASTRPLAAMLDKQSQEFEFHEISSGHNWTMWRNSMARALAYLFPAA